MKLRICFSLFFLTFFGFVISPTIAFGQQTKVVVQRTSTYLTRSYAYKLTDQDFANTPSWNQEDGEPPISITQALKIARANLPNYVEKAELWKSRMITLQNFGEDKWYYRIHFFCFGAGCREIENRSFEAIVKMDGNIVEPKKVTIEK